jgi:hypothetical protein
MAGCCGRKRNKKGKKEVKTGKKRQKIVFSHARMEQLANFIDGNFLPPKQGNFLPSFNPATGKARIFTVCVFVCLGSSGTPAILKNEIR